MRIKPPEWVTNRAVSMVARREPDVIIGNHYLHRWWVIPRNRFFNVYLHLFLHSDDDRALHDHPWWNVSWLLFGTYTEHTPQGKRYFVAGDLRFRNATNPHRIELTNGACWTLFITGPVIREWGFHCPKGWRHWTKFVDTKNPGQVGRGCGED
jgi:hypothetical protein